MKSLNCSLYHSIHRSLRTLLAVSLVFLAGSSCIRAADDYLVNAFDAASEAAQWAKWWGSAPQTYSWDGSMDAQTNSSSGALRVAVQFNLASYGGDNQFAVLRNFSGTLDGSQYTNLIFDIFMDTDSPVRSFGDYGYLEVGFRNQDYSQNWLGGVSLPTTGGWLHFVFPINPNAPKIDTVAGVVLKMWSGDPTWGQTGTTTFWVDNVKLIARTDISAPPPSMTIEKATPGLRMFASAAGSQYQRQSIRTRLTSYSWVGATDPVTYSITISDYPGTNYSGFQTHLFIVHGSSVPNYETSPDWNEPHVVFLQIANNADGSAYAAFRYKVNEPSGNTMIFGNGTIATIGSPQAKGTWNLTFNPAGDINLTAPNGANTNFAMPSGDVGYFSGPAYAYFGVQPNALGNIGQSATLAHIQVTGVAAPIDDTFNSPSLDTTTWEVIADDAAGIVQVPPEAALWLTWTLPDRSFALQITDDLSPVPAWSSLSTVAPRQIGDRRRALVTHDQLPSSSTGNYFFELIKPQ